MKTLTPPKLVIDFHLTDDERSSAVWQSLRGRLEEMLAKKRVENDNPDLTDVETATLRGHLACLKAILALGKEPPAMTATDARPGPRVNLGAKYG